MSLDNDFDVSKPVNKTLVANIPPWIRNVKVQVKNLLSKEHISPGSGGSGCEHVRGSARAYLQSSTPTNRPDGSLLSTSSSGGALYDNGRLAILTGVKAGHNVASVYIATSAGISDGWRDIHVSSAEVAYSLEADPNRVVRLANNVPLVSRNAADNGDVQVLKVNSSNVIELLGNVKMNGKITNLTSPSDNEDAANKQYVDTAISNIFNNYAVVTEEYTQGTFPANPVAGWNDRNVNTIKIPVSWLSLPGNKTITIAAGTYLCRIVSTGYLSHGHKAALYNVSTNEVLLYGTSGHAAIMANTHSHIIGKFTLGSQSVLSIRHYVAEGGLHRFGAPSGVGVETFVVAEFLKIA